ncbi:hypothetical protein [Rhodococcus qingshengii]|uniref:hypothetical protein n=1 Tax=Rhodococcus qingshengii TaxID=334542 RepID=UPI00237C9368|nr:hypothetical protein [Rhodococcus qingshengii]WCT05911.1 hypothetical protein PI247_29230 [Rhodococcus qingshengii]
MIGDQYLGAAGFLIAVIAAALRFAVLVIDDPDDRRLVTNLSVAAAAIGVTLFTVGIVCECGC